MEAYEKYSTGTTVEEVLRDIEEAKRQEMESLEYERDEEEFAVYSEVFQNGVSGTIRWFIATIITAVLHYIWLNKITLSIVAISGIIFAVKLISTALVRRYYIKLSNKLSNLENERGE